MKPLPDCVPCAACGLIITTTGWADACVRTACPMRIRSLATDKGDAAQL